MKESKSSVLDISELPTTEDDYHEYKSSKTSESDLRKKLANAASAFANSGGGVFVVGPDDNGDADGGIAKTIGRQALRDWVDQVVSLVQPCPAYSVSTTDAVAKRGCIKPQKCVIAISFEESQATPHMSSDKRYYIRAGAHTVQAGHFLVESLWAKRHAGKPCLTHAVRIKPGNSNVIQVGVLALTQAPAVDVSVSIDPLPPYCKNLEQYFPLKLPVVRYEDPFFLDFVLWSDDPTDTEGTMLSLEYRDIAGNSYETARELSVLRSISPTRIGKEPLEKVCEHLVDIHRALRSMK